MAHSILPPSSAKAWRQCALWVTMNQRYPKPDTPESMEGTAAHWCWQEQLLGREVKPGAQAPNGVIVTDEMLEAAQVFTDAVREHTAAGTAHIEERTKYASIHPHCQGTPDLWIWHPASWTLDLFDYKHGHRFVDEYENDQCMVYVRDILADIAVQLNMGLGQLDQLVTVRITVVQPRCYHKGKPVRTWTVRASDLRAHWNALSNAAHLALSPEPTATTNSECRDCPGRHACPALQKAAYDAAETALQSVPLELSPQAADLELRMLERAAERLDARIKGLTEQVLALVKRGERVPFHTPQQNYGRLAWKGEPGTIIALGELMGVDLAKPGLITPTQAKNKGIDEAVIRQYTERPMGAITLAPADPSDARRVFGSTTL